MAPPEHPPSDRADQRLVPRTAQPDVEARSASRPTAPLKLVTEHPPPRPATIARSRSIDHSHDLSAAAAKLHSSSHLLTSSATAAKDSTTTPFSPRLLASRAAAAAAAAEKSPESKPYGHHRKTSIVHGIQHSRNGSIASPTTSPLSPQMIAAAAGALATDPLSAAMARMDSDGASMMPNTLLSSPAAASSSPAIIAPTGSSAVMASERAASAMDTHSALSQKRIERMLSSRSRREFGHVHSHSRHHHKDEQKTVGEYALHVLFTSFIAQSEEKITQCIITTPLDPEPHIDRICGPGADPTFDQLIAALGHIAAPKPKPLIDALMLWRKNKSDAASEARVQLQQLRTAPTGPGAALLRRNTEPQPAPEGLDIRPSNAQMSLAARQDFVAQAERRSTVSIYLLCRVLTEVIGQSTLASITPDMEEKLEGIIFIQLKMADPDQLLLSPLKLSNWFLFSQLLGVMSDINFVSVTERFIGDLERCQKELVVKSMANRDVEARMELVLGGMRYMRIKQHPEAAWDQSCDFLCALARLFTKCHGHRLKYAYCQILETLLLPITAAVTPELMTPKWNDFLAIAGPRLASLFLKPRHWAFAFPLTATMLCVSPADTFSQQWMNLLVPLQPKLKDRSTRATCFQVISRLLWTYIYRIQEPPSVTLKKLDEVVRLILPPGKKSYVSTDPVIAEPLIQIICIIGFKWQEFAFKNIVFPLINAELFVSGRELKVEHLEPEKISIGIRAFLAIMEDIEKGEPGRPPFPQDYPALSLFERIPTSPVFHNKSPPAPPREERLSRPVIAAALSDVAKEYYARFCEILSKITIICDDAFGGQAALDEKFSSPASKTPITETFNFTRRDDHQSPSDQKQGYYELLHVAVQALPRCLSPHIQFNSLINLLCTGTAHVQFNIAESSAQSLKSIARQSHAQQVTIGFAHFIFNFDDRYSTMSDGGMLGSGHIESTLKLYVELLQIWIEEIKQRSKDMPDAMDDGSADRRGAQLDRQSILNHVDEVESHGLFFLCSQSRRVRAFAVTVLRLITEFDTALGQKSIRLTQILEGGSAKLLEFNDENLSVAERSRLQRGLRNGNSQSVLIELCSSDVSYDTTLWFKIFPNLINMSHQTSFTAVMLARELICNRILQMYKAVVFVAEGSRGTQLGSDGARVFSRTPTTPPDVLIEQWKLYLIVACNTLSDKGVQPLTAQPAQHLRKGSKPAQSQEKITSARKLFNYLIPLLSVQSTALRESVVVGLGSINVNIYKTLLEELVNAVSLCNDEARARIQQRSAGSPRRGRRTDLLRTEITHVYRLTAHFLKAEPIFTDDWILNNLVNYTKDLKLFLMDDEIQMDWEFQKLRRHYCGLVEDLFEGINRTKDPSRWMTFESRKSSFALMEDWCGYSPNQNQIRQREDTMRQSMINQQGVGERTTLTAAMEIEKRNLKTAALSAMAALCGGPLSITTESRSNLQFDIRRMLTWIDTIFNRGSDRIHVIGRRALKSLIIHNKDYPYLLEHSISRCYLAENPKVLQSYFQVVTEVLLEHPDYPMPFWRLISIGLYTLGSETAEIRSKAAHVLRLLEERQQRSSKIQDFDISISDRTKAVYKLAQFEISKRLSKQHSELAFLIFSEFTLYFKEVQPNQQRNMVAAILPWIQIVELQLDPNGGPTAESYVLLANLFEITIKSSSVLHNEVQALWQALATGPHGGNVRLVLDFIISLCLDRREQNFVEFAKQIVVFLSSTPAGGKVVEFLLMQITPKAMIPNEKRDTLPPPPDASLLPYVAELSEALPHGAKQAAFSLGQLALILLVDLMVSPVQLVAENVPLLLQVVTVLWDHYIPLVQEEAREMLIHLIHELIISRIEDEHTEPSKKAIEDLIDSIRRYDATVIWAYDDGNGKVGDGDARVPPGMEYLATQVVSNFELTYPGIKEQWAKLSLTWATSCPVRHLACRSFQVFRCILTSLDQSMLADMLVRLSNTIADEDNEIQTFSMEILMTLKTLISKLDSADLLNFPQLFWTTCACLDTINECEFIEALGMLEELLDKVDLHNPTIRKLLADGRPPKWEGPFEGLQPLIYKGLRSSTCLDQTLESLNKLVQLPSDELVGDDSRLLFAILANFPLFLHGMEQDPIDPQALQNAHQLSEIASSQGLEHISLILGRFANNSHHSSKDLLAQLAGAIKEAFFPIWDFKCLVFLMSLLTNKIPWFTVKTMSILCAMIPEVDMRRPEIASHGSDLISPLLRLLQTEFCMQALEVLDHIMTMTSTPMDRHHLRMSMTRSTSKAIRKEYERTQSLFGIPEDSGWSIPVPAKHAETTRANVHAAFYMCQSAENEVEVTETPDVEFHVDEFQYGYFPEDRTGTMMSDDGRAEGHIGDLVMKLDSLDDFFEDSLQTTHHPDSQTSAREFPGSFNSGAQLYDEQTLPILHQSLSPAESTSFQNGFADFRPMPPNTMNPGAFNLDVAAAKRPGMHARSITSPSAPASFSVQSTLDFTSDDDFIDEVFSDGDEDRAPPSSEGSFFLENMIKPITQSTRSGMRRLTGGRLRDADKIREALRADRRGVVTAGQKSPRVPRVPTAFLNKGPDAI